MIESAADDQGSRPVAYLTAEDVAALLQVSTKTVRRWAAADATMPVLKIGAVTRFPRERLERWLRGREQGPGRPRRRPA
jgi:excisionase family DNA binding protein